MSKIINSKYKLSSEFVKGIFLTKDNVFIFNTTLGIRRFHMPNFYFLKKNDDKLSLIFDDYHKFNMVFRQLIRIFSSASRIYFFKLKLRGLGYKLVSYLRKRLIKFFFAYNHFFYLHVPKNVFFKRIKRRFIFFSNDLSLLNDLFVKIIKLKKMDFYERANTFIVAKKILYIKKRK